MWETVVIDMDADDDLDIIAFYQDKISLFTNNGQGKFTLSDTLEVWTRSCSVADVNGDTLPDIVWADPIHDGNDEDNLLVSFNQYRSGKDNLKGTKSNDVLKGFGNKDKLDGKAGTDWLWGGFGADKLKGGKGGDAFVFKSLADSTVKAAGRDTILDFKRGQGDKIDIAAICAASDPAGIEFIGKKKFSGDAPEIRYVRSDGKTVISLDFDADGKSDFAITLAKSIALKETDFLM